MHRYVIDINEKQTLIGQLKRNGLFQQRASGFTTIHLGCT